MLATATLVLITLIALEHICFMILEMFLWNSTIGRKAFGTTKEFANSSAALAKNQGLYNGFLAAGLIWSLINPVPELAFSLKVFFLICVVVAGIFGGFTVNKKIAFVQALPALIALVLVLAAN